MTEGKRSNSSLSAQALPWYVDQPCPAGAGRKTENMRQKQITVCQAQTPVRTARRSETQDMPQQGTATQFKRHHRDQLRETLEELTLSSPSSTVVPTQVLLV